MIDPQLSSALLLVVGGATVLLSAQARRPDLRSRLRLLDGVPRPSRRTWWRAGVSVLLVAAVPAVPLLVVGTGQAAVGAVLALALAPFAVTIGTELYVGLRRRGMPVRIPLTAGWQRRWAAAHVARILAPFPAPPLRRRPPRVRRRPPALTSAGGGRRLLVVPPGSPTMRPWELAETYLGSRRRYRDVLSLNAGRRSPGGALITEDSRIGPGWVLIVPRDAIGVGLVDLPGDPRLDWPGTEDRGPAAPSGSATVAEDVPLAPETPEPEVYASTAPAQPDRGAAAEPLDGRGPDAGEDAAPREDEGGDQRVEGEAAGAADHPPAALPWDLVHAQMLADGLVTALAERRVQRDHDRPFGAEVQPVRPEVAAVAAAARLGADASGADLLDRALRAFPVATRPHVIAARVVPGGVEFALAAPDHRPPRPFRTDASGRRWSLPGDAQLPPPGGRSAFPGLVSLGRDRAGWVLVDLLAAGGPIGIVGDRGAARLVASAIALELLFKRWSDDLRVVLVGFGLPLARLDPRLTCADRIEEVLEQVVRRGVDNHHAVTAGRPDEVVPQFLVLAEPPPQPAFELLRHLIGQHVRAPIAVLVVGRSRHDRWTFELDAGGVLRCRPLNLIVGAQALSPDTVGAVAELLRAETVAVLRDPAAQEPVPPPGLPRRVDPEPEIVVHLFGSPPQLHGPEGPLDADPVSTEIVAFLALRGTTTREELAAAVFPSGIPAADLETALKIVAQVLLGAPSGEPGVLEYPDGTLALTDDVQLDWHLFVAQCVAGRVDQALEMLNAVASPAATARDQERRYGWLTGLPISRTMPGYLADVAHGVVAHRLGQGRPDLAIVAASAALRVLPFNQVLRDDLEAAVRGMRPEHLVAGSGPAS